jgi:hypothetical protein
MLARKTLATIMICHKSKDLQNNMIFVGKFWSGKLLEFIYFTKSQCRDESHQWGFQKESVLE